MKAQLSKYWVGEGGRLYDEWGDKVWGVCKRGFLTGSIYTLRRLGVENDWMPI